MCVGFFFFFSQNLMICALDLVCCSVCIRIGVFFHEIAKGEIVRILDPMCGRRAKKENRKKKQEQKLVCVHKSAQVHKCIELPISLSVG